MANNKDTDLSSPPSAPVPASAVSEHTDLQAHLTTHADQIAQLAAELARQKSALQHAESALIARIGDVDDDRRHADIRLQRAWQTQTGEIAARITRQGWRVALVLLVCGILTGLALAFFYARFDATRQEMREEIAQLRIALDQRRIPSPDTTNPAPPIQDKLIQDKLSRLSTSIQAISASLDALDPPPAQATPAIPDGPPQTSDESSPADAPPPPVAEMTTDGAIGMTPAPASTPPPPTVVTDSPESSPPPPEPALIDAPPLDANPSLTNAEAVNASAKTAPALERITVGEQIYALQLIGFHSLAALQTFLDRFDLSSRTIYYREETYRGRPWFALIYSLHASREAATAAIATLPAGLGELDIWVRKLDPETTLVVLGKASD